MFLTIEDEGGIANLVVWPSVFERYRRIVLGSRMLGVLGRIQKQGEVIYLVAERLDDLSGLLASDGSRNQLGHPPRDIDIRDLRLGSGIKVPTRTFAEEEGDADAPGLIRPMSPRLNECRALL